MNECVLCFYLFGSDLDIQKGLFILFKSIIRDYALLCVICMFFASAPFLGALAQVQKIDVPFDVRVIDTIELMSDTQQITLWGVEKVQNNTVILNLSARSALEEKIGTRPVLCDIEHVENGKISAQCTNSSQEDVSLFLLQQGYVNADRKVLRGTIYEQPYLKAEKEARENGRGVWAENGASSQYGFSTVFMVLGAVFALALCALGLMILRGFKNAVEVQNRSIDIAEKERALKNQEKHIVASMLLAEVKSNRTKIEAYLMIYQDVLKGIITPSSATKYQAGGDIIQKQPALSRVVFDSNASRLEMMGAPLASDIIHYYARIKTVPDYAEVKPEDTQKDVQKLVETAIDNAQKLDSLSEGLVQEFMVHGLMGVD